VGIMADMKKVKEPTFTRRTWGEEVALADARSGVVPPLNRRKEGGGYEFSNRRKFDDSLGAYAPRD